MRHAILLLLSAFFLFHPLEGEADVLARKKGREQVSELVKNLKNGERIPEGTDLFGADLSGAKLYKADLSRVDMSGAKLSGADLSGAKLSGADLSGADLSGAKLSEADLSRVDMSGADLSEAKLSEADLSRVDMSGANLYKADLRRAKLYKADLRRAKLYKADLRRAKLYKADLSGADLRGADLSKAKLSRADIIGELYKADLKGAIYDDKTVFPTGFDPKSAGMVKADVKKESADKKLSIQGCEGGEMSPDEKIITCPNRHIYQRADSPILDALRSHGKEQIVPLLPLGQEDAGGGAIGQ